MEAGHVHVHVAREDGRGGHSSGRVPDNRPIRATIVAAQGTAADQQGPSMDESSPSLERHPWRWKGMAVQKGDGGAEGDVGGSGMAAGKGTAAWKGTAARKQECGVVRWLVRDLETKGCTWEEILGRAN
ncbi:hypothetical protein GUJ93_ZPchr0009g1224 [Zizania palustris]|uniref:Uncharacterized protein n=1 Tax=Zizania palustris TaxID=103762 RepID=A0A8J5RNR7_ZIZPA|nr:hypothetical protein GUJ93_ZPchr0009g1224 [Zizania palustris]